MHVLNWKWTLLHILGEKTAVQMPTVFVLVLIFFSWHVNFLSWKLKWLCLILLCLHHNIGHREAIRHRNCIDLKKKSEVQSRKIRIWVGTKHNKAMQRLLLICSETQNEHFYLCVCVCVCVYVCVYHFSSGDGAAQTSVTTIHIVISFPLFSPWSFGRMCFRHMAPNPTLRHTYTHVHTHTFRHWYSVQYSSGEPPKLRWHYWISLQIGIYAMHHLVTVNMCGKQMLSASEWVWRAVEIASEWALTEWERQRGWWRQKERRKSGEWFLTSVENGFGGWWQCCRAL